jgi:hypothetical protein
MGTWKIHTRNPAGLHKSDDLVKVSPSRNPNFFRRENVRPAQNRSLMCILGTLILGEFFTSEINRENSFKYEIIFSSTTNSERAKRERV